MKTYTKLAEYTEKRPDLPFTGQHRSVYYATNDGESLQEIWDKEGFLAIFFDTQKEAQNYLDQK